jgi:hypothetical protein
MAVSASLPRPSVRSRTFIDVERCACGGKLERIAVLEVPAVIEKILKHIGLSPPTPRTKARRVELFGAD